MTLQATLLNRNTVLQWLENSNVYSRTIDSVVSLNLDQSADSVLSQDVLKNAVSDTLDPVFVEDVSETAINAAFDWLEGKSETIEFSIPLIEKRDELQQNLINALVPEFKDLPTCNMATSGLNMQHPGCVPPNVSAEDAAAVAAKQAVDSTDFLTQPITDDVLGEDYLNVINWLPTLVQNMGVISVLLIVLGLAAGTGFILLSENRLVGGRKLTGTVLFGSSLSAMAGGTLWFIGTNLNLGSTPGEDAIVTALIQNVLQPIISQVLPSIGTWLAVFAGGVALVSAIAWITLIVVSRRLTPGNLDTATSSAAIAKNEPVEPKAAPSDPEEERRVESDNKDDQKPKAQSTGKA